MKKFFAIIFSACLFLGMGDVAQAATNSLVWHDREKTFDADIVSSELNPILQKIAAMTGWQVYLEPGISHTVSAKFRHRSRTEALHLLLGKLSFEISPQSNSIPKLFVFQTGAEKATQLINGKKGRVLLGKNKIILNHLIVTLKPGSSVSINALTKQLGATLIGKIDGQNSYLLEFPDEASAIAAREQLSRNDSIASIDSNYFIDPPHPNQVATLESGSAGLPFNLKSDVGAGDGKQIVVGLVDTPVQSLSANMQAFLLPSISAVGETSFDDRSPTHGTMMAESILYGLNSTADQNSPTSVKVLPVSVYKNDDSTTAFNIANGIIVAANNGANLISVSSAGYGDSEFLRTVTAQVTDKGIVIFAAAGNEPVSTPTYPASYSDVVAVTSSQDRTGTIASYANYGDFVDVILPGGTIISYNNDSYYVNGTSVSTALASGMLAGMASATQQTPTKVLPSFRQRTAFRK